MAEANPTQPEASDWSVFAASSKSKAPAQVASDKAWPDPNILAADVSHTGHRP